MKGAYNYTDLNRVESIVAELDYWFEIGLETKTDWTMYDVPTKADMERYLGNVATIRQFIIDLVEGSHMLLHQLPDNMSNFNWIQANAIEQVLHVADSFCALLFRQIPMEEASETITIDGEGVVDTASANPVDAESEPLELWSEAELTETEGVPVGDEMPFIIDVEANLYVWNAAVVMDAFELFLDVTGNATIGTGVSVEDTSEIAINTSGWMEVPDAASIELVGNIQMDGEGEIISPESSPIDVKADPVELFGEAELLSQDGIPVSGLGDIEIAVEAELSVVDSIDMEADIEISVIGEGILIEKSELIEWIYPVQTENYLYIKQVTTVVKEENDA